MNNLTKQNGFTLIELVVVIVILGILAVTAAPKFIDLTSDARASVVEGVRGAVNSAADLAHAKALVSGQTGPLADGDTITVGGVAIALNYGWPTSTSILLLIDQEDMVTTAVSGTVVTLHHTDATTPANCLTTYDDTLVGNTEIRPTITSDVTDC
jgi:MSHA pilin protein MshA